MLKTISSRGSKWIARVVKSISNSILCSDVGSIERETTIVMRTRAHVLSNRFISQHLFSDRVLRFWNSPQFFLVLLLVGQTSLLFQCTEWSPNHLQKCLFFAKESNNNFEKHWNNFSLLSQITDHIETFFQKNHEYFLFQKINFSWKSASLVGTQWCWKEVFELYLLFPFFAVSI